MTRWRDRNVHEARCREVGRVLQSSIDGEADDLTTRRVRQHLSRCRRCGLEADTYAAIKGALRRREPQIPPEVLRRLSKFGARLAVEWPGPHRAV